MVSFDKYEVSTFGNSPSKPHVTAELGEKHRVGLGTREIVSSNGVQNVFVDFFSNFRYFFSRDGLRRQCCVTHPVVQVRIVSGWTGRWRGVRTCQSSWPMGGGGSKKKANAVKTSLLCGPRELTTHARHNNIEVRATPLALRRTWIVFVVIVVVGHLFLRFVDDTRHFFFSVRPCVFAARLSVYSIAVPAASDPYRAHYYYHRRRRRRLPGDALSRRIIRRRCGARAAARYTLYFTHRLRPSCFPRTRVRYTISITHTHTHNNNYTRCFGGTVTMPRARVMDRRRWIIIINTGARRNGVVRRRRFSFPSRVLPKTRRRRLRAAV